MKVICINNSTNSPNALKYRLTINKCYDSISISVNSIDSNRYFYWIKNDIDGVAPYDTKLFLTLKEYRKLKLNNINEFSRRNM